METMNNGMGMVFGVANTPEDIQKAFEAAMKVYGSSQDSSYDEEDDYDEEDVEIAAPLLTPKEAAYLYATTRPFRRFVLGIEKRKYETVAHGTCEQLSIICSTMEDEDGNTVDTRMCLPVFPEGRYYNGMKPNVVYSLEELGLLD